MKRSLASLIVMELAGGSLKCDLPYVRSTNMVLHLALDIM